MEKMEIFRDNQVLYERLYELGQMKENLKELKGNLYRPQVIDLLGSPSICKTSLAFNVCDFLKKMSSKISFIDELSKQARGKLKNNYEKLKQDLSDLVFKILNSLFAFYVKFLNSIRKKYLSLLSSDDKKMIDEMSLRKYLDILFKMIPHLQKQRDLCSYLDTLYIMLMDGFVDEIENIGDVISSNVKILQKSIF